MNEWWMNLNLREKQALSIGGLFLLLFLLYEIIWAPISNYNDSLRNEISHNQKLLVWMQEANQHIIATEKMLKKDSSGKNSAALLALLQKEINQSPFAKNLTQLSQAENNSVLINLKQVNFDELITWLTTLWQKQGLTVFQITTTPNGPLGTVDVVMMMV